MNISSERDTAQHRMLRSEEFRRTRHPTPVIRPDYGIDHLFGNIHWIVSCDIYIHLRFIKRA